MKKNLLIVIPQLNIGGAEKQLQLHVKYLNKDKYNIYLINLDANANLLENEFNLLLTENVINIYDKSKLSIIKNIITVLVDKKIDILHTWLNNDWGRIAGIYYKTILRKKIHIIASERNDMFMSNRKFANVFIYLNYLLSFFTNYVTFNSEVPISKLNKFWYNKNSIIFIANGIELTLNDYKDSYKVNEKLTLIILARLTQIKNHSFLLKAINEYENKANLLLKIVGNGSEHDELVQYVNENDLSDIVTFYGEIKEPNRMIQECDVGILVSKSEGFSNTILEYMLNAKAIIATDVGSNKLCITNNGFLVDGKEEFHSALDKYIADRDFLLFHQKNSLKNIDLFDIKNITLKYESLYDEL